MPREKAGPGRFVGIPTQLYEQGSCGDGPKGAQRYSPYNDMRPFSHEVRALGRRAHFAGGLNAGVSADGCTSKKPHDETSAHRQGEPRTHHHGERRLSAERGMQDGKYTLGGFEVNGQRRPSAGMQKETGGQQVEA